MAEYANWKSGQVESLVIVCGFDSHLGYSLKSNVEGSRIRFAGPVC